MKFVEIVADIICKTLLDPEVLKKIPAQERRIYAQQRKTSILIYDENAFK